VGWAVEVSMLQYLVGRRNIFSSLGSYQAFYSVGFFWVTPGGGGGLRSLFLAHNMLISESENLAV
jgi:hypothetical protein